MAITINWGTKVINVPRLDMTLVQSSPFEIRELNLNTFRLTLKDLEDDEVGMSFLATHNHVAPVTVGGVTLARVVELINGYTVTFEDGVYAVNLVGANSNVADKTNLNQVSVRASNSAGLVEVGGADPAVIADAVWDEMLMDHYTEGSVGVALMHVHGMVQHNYVLDQTVYNDAGLLLSARMRLFGSAADTAAATAGGVGEGELATMYIMAEADPTLASRLKIYKVLHP